MTTRNDQIPCLAQLNLGRGPDLGGTVSVVTDPDGDGVDIVWTSPLRDKPLTLRLNGLHSELLCELIAEATERPPVQAVEPTYATVIPLRRRP